MTTISSLIEQLLIKSGKDVTDPKYASLLASTLPVDVELIESVNSFITIETAKAHPDIKKHYMAQAFNAIDTELLKHAHSNQLTDEQVAVLKSEKSTPRRLELFNEMLQQNKLAEIETLRKTAPNNNAAKEQMDKLVKELNDIKEATAKEKEALLNDFEKERVNLELEKVIGSLKWSEAYKDDKIKRVVFETKLNDFLLENKAEIKRENGKIVLVDSETKLQKLGANNLPLNFEEQAKKLALDNNFIAVSPAPATTLPNVPNTTQAPPSNTNDRYRVPILDALHSATNTQ
jgi:hypothetical protein